MTMQTNETSSYSHLFFVIALATAMLVVLCTVGCEDPGEARGRSILENMDGVELGMSMSEVRSVMGEPAFRKREKERQSTSEVKSAKGMPDFRIREEDHQTWTYIYVTSRSAGEFHIEFKAGRVSKAENKPYYTPPPANRSEANW